MIFNSAAHGTRTAKRYPINVSVANRNDKIYKNATVLDGSNDQEKSCLRDVTTKPKYSIVSTCKREI